MKLTYKELLFVRGTLLARRIYTRQPEVWQPWMKSFLQKIEDELEPHNPPPWPHYS
jgi:hypothetical protein